MKAADCLKVGWDNGDFRDGRMSVEELLNFRRPDLESRAVDHGNPVAALDPKAAQRVRGSVAVLVEVAIGDRVALEDERGAVRPEGTAADDVAADVHLRRPSRASV